MLKNIWNSYITAAEITLHILILACICLISLSVPETKAEEETKEPPAAMEIIEQFRTAAAEVVSASYTVYRSDYADDFVVERHKKALEAYRPILDKISFVTRKKYTVDTAGGSYRETISEVIFIKPFSIQAKMLQNDYIPDFLKNSHAVYRPETNPHEAFLKEPYLGLMFRESVDVDSAVTMVVNWAFDMLELDCALANAGEAALAGTEQVDGRDAYRLDIPMKNDTIPWNMNCAEETYGIPAEATGQMNLELGMIGERIDLYNDTPGILSLWIDKENSLIVRKEHNFGDILAMKSRKEDLELNKVNEKRMFKVKKP